MNSSSDNSSNGQAKDLRISAEMINDLENSRCLLRSSLKLEHSTTIFESPPKKRLVKTFSLNTEASETYLGENNPA